MRHGYVTHSHYGMRNITFTKFTLSIFFENRPQYSFHKAVIRNLDFMKGCLAFGILPLTLCKRKEVNN